MFLSANVQFEFSSTILHIALRLNSHLQVQHVNIHTHFIFMSHTSSLAGLFFLLVFIALQSLPAGWALTA